MNLIRHVGLKQYSMLGVNTCRRHSIQQKITIERSQYLIRPAEPQDEEEISTLLQESYPKLMRSCYNSEVLDVALPAMTAANPALLSCGTYYIIQCVDAENCILACGGWTQQAPGRVGSVVSSVGHIRHFATHPDWTGNGLGKAFLDRCVHEAQAVGLSHLECFSCINAEGFYRAAGFEVVERTSVPMGVISFPCTLMRRQL